MTTFYEFMEARLNVALNINTEINVVPVTCINPMADIYAKSFNSYSTVSRH